MREALVHNDTFPAAAGSWWGFDGTHPFHGTDHGSALSTCGRFGTLLGGHRVLGRGAWLRRELSLQAPHGYLRVFHLQLIAGSL